MLLKLDYLIGDEAGCGTSCLFRKVPDGCQPWCKVVMHCILRANCSGELYAELYVEPCKHLSKANVNTNASKSRISCFVIEDFGSKLQQ